MFDLPLHPMVVHVPIALALLLPLLTVVVFWGIKRWAWPTGVWGVLVVAQAVLLASSVAAVKSGEQDEDKIEPYVQAQTLEEHEEWGERLPWVAGSMLVLYGLPLVIRKRRTGLMALALVGSLATLPVVIRIGHLGGTLVYMEGAAQGHQAVTGSEASETGDP